jgi:hypothetical protein
MGCSQRVGAFGSMLGVALAGHARQAFPAGMFDLDGQG